jgi:PAS domain S-box-containing protein
VTGESKNEIAEYEVKGKDGIVHFIEAISAPYYKNKEITGIQGIARDVTERKHAEEKIALLAHSLKSINECVSITDMEDKFQFVNESFLKTYGYNENELIGKNASMVRSPKNSPELVKEILPSTLHGGWKGELWNRKKDGREFQIFLSTTIINDKEGNPLGLIGVAIDITELKRTEKELIEAKEKAEESDKLKSEFLAQMSHEIRTPLNVIVSNVDYLNDYFSGKMDKDSRECFDGINLASKRIIRTVDLVLNAAELQSSEYKQHFIKIDLKSEILDKMYHEYQLSAKQKGLEFIFTCNENETNIIADEYSITQIFANLIDNAIKYTNKGKVEILLGKNKTGNIIVEIKDTGIGISKEFLTKMFEPFTQEEQGYTRSFEGNGLGLALAKRYCEINNIIIEVDSVKNEGSTFRIIFNSLHP